MQIVMKKSLSTIILCFQTLFLTGQTLICTEHISKENIHSEELLTAVKTHINRVNPHNNRTPTIYLVDFFQKEGLNKYRIIANKWPCAPLFRQPDCIVRLDSFTIVFLYTPDYRKPKDSLFLDILEREMSSVFNQTMGYNWETMTTSRYVRWPVIRFTPKVVEYIFQEGKLINVRPYDRMYYEDLPIPPSFIRSDCRDFCPRCRREADDYQYRLKKDTAFAQQERIRFGNFIRERNENKKLEFPIGTHVKAWVTCPNSSMRIQIIGEVIEWRVAIRDGLSVIFFSNIREDGSSGPQLQGPEMELEYLEAKIKIIEFADSRRAREFRRRNRLIRNNMLWVDVGRNSLVRTDARAPAGADVHVGVNKAK